MQRLQSVGNEMDTMHDITSDLPLRASASGFENAHPANQNAANLRAPYVTGFQDESALPSHIVHRFQRTSNFKLDIIAFGTCNMQRCHVVSVPCYAATYSTIIVLLL